MRAGRPPNNATTWSPASGQLIHIWADTLEDQLAAEALAASPLNFEHDNKENIASDGSPDLQSDSGLEDLDNPASQREPTDVHNEEPSSSSLVSHALYMDFEQRPQVYGLDGTDGARDKQNDTSSTQLPLNVLRLLKSSESLLRAADLDGDQELYSVKGLHSHNTSKR